MTPVDSRLGRHAIVVGGSMAGLLAARVLTDHFAEVTLIERDRLPDGVEQRRGVPQGHHTHGLLAGGSQALDYLFAGFSADAVREGAVPGDIVHDLRWFFEGAALARPRTGMDGLMATRPFLEAQVRRRVLALANLHRRDGCRVAALTSADDRGRVTGVTLETGETVTADLVVDATGRGSRAFDWLQALGYEVPREETVEIGLGYTTRFFQRDPRHLGGDLGTIVPPTPLGKRGGVMVAQEGRRWTVTLISHFVPAAPHDVAGFRHFASQLPSPDIHAVIATAEPVGDAMGARFPASVRRRYERLSRFPEGFVVVGDAICSFNPIYGQGMSVAALEALALADVVAAGTGGVGRRFFAKAARIIDTPWITAAGNDLRMPEAVGPRSVVDRVINAYMARLHRVAHADDVLATRFMQVANLLAPPTQLFAPSTAWRVLRGSPAIGPGRTADVGHEAHTAERA